MLFVSEIGRYVYFEFAVNEIFNINKKINVTL